MEPNVQTSQNVETTTGKEVSSRKILNVVGIFLFGGYALTSVTTPIPSYEIKNFFLFIFGSAIIYYFLVNIYSIGKIGKKMVLTVLILIGGFSIYMAYYLATNSIPY